MNTRYTALLILIFCSLTNALAQFSPYNHPELKWQTIETEHFEVHFHDGTERTAREVAGIAETVYAPITKMYDYEPEGKVHFIIRDHDDYSNGASYFYDQKILIWSSPLDFELRGQHHWLYDVVTHEFTHMIQLGAARKGPRWLPGVYFQVIGYEVEKRPDVLYGYPNVIASWPVAGTQVPMWFAEGTAQFQASGAHHDWWDTHRDMMLRTRSLDGNLLKPSQMDVFGKSSIESEYVYNQGYALVRYIAEEWGDEAVVALTEYAGKPYYFDFGRATRKVLGLSERELYNRWTRQLSDDYGNRTETIKANLQVGEVIRDEGFGNLYPTFSPDGAKLAFISNKGQDYLSLGSVVIYDVEQDTVTDTECPAGERIVWSPDGKYLLYARQKSPNRHGSNYNDLYLWDVDGEKEIRLTRDARLNYASFSPDGKKIIAVHSRDGSHNLTLITLPEVLKGKDVSDSVEIEILTRFNNGRQIYSPAYSASGDWIVCASSLYNERDLYRYDLETGEFAPYILTGFDERDPFFTSDGKWFYWSDDRTGIFNIYRKDLDTGVTDAVTNVLGGAFLPNVNDDGKLAFSRFTSSGYGMSLIDDPVPVDFEDMDYGQQERERIDLSQPKLVDAVSRPYATPFLHLSLLPRFAWDYGRFKPGIYAYTGDVLERLTLFGGAAATTDGDRDIYGIIEYRMLYPTIFLEAFNIVRNNTETFDDQFVIIGEEIIDSVAVPLFDTYGVEYRFNLAEYDLGLRIPIPGDFLASVTARFPSYKAELRFDDGGTFDYTYFKGVAYILRLDTDKRALEVGRDIHSSGGWRGWAEFAYEDNRFLDSFRVDLDKGLLKEVYRPYRYSRLEFDLDYYHTLLGDWVLNPRIIGGMLSSDSVDDFFHLYAGGLLGLRGYSFYSLGGSKKGVARLSLRFPLATEIDKGWGPFYLDRLHGALFAESGNAWSTDFDPKNLKNDVGGELRLKMFSWYGFPTDIQFTGAYGLDRFSVFDGAQKTDYGGEWRWYFTLLFDFL